MKTDFLVGTLHYEHVKGEVFRVFLALEPDGTGFKLRARCEVRRLDGSRWRAGDLVYSTDRAHIILRDLAHEPTTKFAGLSSEQLLELAEMIERWNNKLFPKRKLPALNRLVSSGSSFIHRGRPSAKALEERAHRMAGQDQDMSYSDADAGAS